VGLPPPPLGWRIRLWKNLWPKVVVAQQIGEGH
jgi:hypothetical protein